MIDEDEDEGGAASVPLSNEVLGYRRGNSGCVLFC